MVPPREDAVRTGATRRHAVHRHPRHGDALTKDRVRFALAELDRSGVLTGTRSKKLSMRVDPGLIEAARRRTGLDSDSELVNAALAIIAAGDDFGAWLVQQAGRLPADFELDL